ncbi:MAG: sigma-70 family RNA polymerase sigma factor [Acidimicrobiia bacterium]|nr:sigma-70 family RNA polymerase sigma factor [Acidimicrobiia bacterium]
MIRTEPMEEVEQPASPRLVPRRFEDFYRAEWDSVYRPLLATIGDPHLAKDATAEAMARAYQRWSKVRTYRNPSGWVYRVGLNWARSRFRRQRREVLGEPHVAPAAADNLPDNDLDAALRSLPLDQRSVIVLRYYMDWSQEEIANALRVPVGTVKSRLHRGLRKLEQEVTR